MEITSQAPLSFFCHPSQVVAEMRASPHRGVFRFALILAGVGLLVRLWLFVVAGNLPISPLSGASDQTRYQTLADNLYEGRGFTYAGQPTALRPPLYPIFLVAMRWLFGAHRFFAARSFQFLAALAMVYLSVLLGRWFFGIDASALAGAFALALPTLAFGVTELQSEALASCFTLLFLCFLMAELNGMRFAALGMGLASGIAILLRFNSALLVPVGAAVCLCHSRSWRRAVVVCVTSIVIISPWIIHTARVFHGRILFSSQAGVNLLQGMLTPEGRTQAKDGDRIRQAVGWSHHDIETNQPDRLRLPGEDLLDRQARSAAIASWKQMSWGVRLKLLGRKLVAFLLSTDQLLDTTSFSAKQRVLRGAGVVCYWFVLLLAAFGWARLLTQRRFDEPYPERVPIAESKAAAIALGLYVIVVTLAHLPFVMNTRLRIPSFDALFAVFAAGGFVILSKRFQAQRAHTA